jgi:Fic family protein
MNYQQLDLLKAKLDRHRPLNDQVLNNLREDLIVRFTYNSNAIEGNTLSLSETKVALEGITIGGKTMREHCEAINHKEAILFIETLSQQPTPINELDIKLIHALILKNIDDNNAGKYRTTNVIISGAKHIPPQGFEVNLLMEQFIQWYQTNYTIIHPVELAARVHVDLVKIHPFIDGNGRTARLLMNLELMKAGFPPAIITVADRLEYYNALDDAHIFNDYTLFFNLMSKIVEQSFTPYFFVLGEQ